MKKKYLLTVRAEDRPGLLHLVTGVLNRRLIPVISLTAAPADVHGIVLITIETMLIEHEVATLSRKLENIIEVISVDVNAYEENNSLRAAWFKLDKALLDTPKAAVINKYNGAITHWSRNAFLLAKCGSDKVIRELYNQLDGKFLLGFNQTGLLNDSELMDHDSEDRISRLAA